MSAVAERTDAPAETGSGMATALRTELRKLATTRLWWILGMVAVAVAVLVTVLTVAGSEASEHPPLDIFTGALIGGVQTAYMITAIVGITAVTGEYRHHTATASYLAIPHRGRLISAKLIVLTGYGLFVGVVVVGVAVGALLRNQIAAVAALLIYLFAIEQTINSIALTRPAYPFLPGGAVQALAFSGRRAFGSATGAELLNPWLAAVLIVGYAVAITAIAVRTTIRRDVS